MRVAQLLLALLLTVLILYGARKTSMRTVRPTVEVVSKEGFSLTHTCVQVIKGDDTPAHIGLKVTEGSLPKGSSVDLYERSAAADRNMVPSPFQRQTLKLIEEDQSYVTEVANPGRGRTIDYYLQVSDSAGMILATVPSANSAEARPVLQIRFEGKRSIPLLAGHILGMFGSFLFMTLAFLTSLGKTDREPDSIRLGKHILWATLILFLGTFPIGFWINHQVYGYLWTGVPIGRDITDSKALLVFLYWLLLLILLRGSAFRSRPSGNSVRPGLARILTVFGFALTVVVYLYPHSAGNF